MACVTDFFAEWKNKKLLKGSHVTGRTASGVKTEVGLALMPDLLVLLVSLMSSGGSKGGLVGLQPPPYGLQSPLEQGELEEEKVKGEEEEEEEGFSPPMAVTWIRHWVLCKIFWKLNRT